MDSWPRDDRELANTVRHRNARSIKHVANAYPSLRQGLLGAATLQKNDGKFEWSFLQRSQSSARRWRQGKTIHAFPPTRPPALHSVPYSTKQQAEQGANFLRTFMPDVEIPSELIRDHIAEETTLCNQLNGFDPYIGDLLVSFQKPVAKASAQGVLAFATGENLSNLNLSSYEVHSAKGLTLKMVAEPAIVYKTPIQQIAANHGAEPHLAIRTFAQVNLLKLNKLESATPFESLATFTRQQTDGREVVDVKLSASGINLVNNCGHVYHQNFSSVEAPLTFLGSPVQTEDTAVDHFWRLASDKQDVSFLLSCKQLWTCDHRTKALVPEWELASSKELMTSIEDSRPDNIVRLCSTNSLVWLDRRNMKRPLVSLCHYREYDRYLRTQTIGGSSPITLLTTRRNNLISIYDASRGNNGLFHIQGSPHALLLDSPDSGFSLGETVLTSPFESNDFVLMRLSERGALQGHKVLSGEDDEGFPVQLTGASQLPKLDSKKLSVDVGPRGGRERSDVDFSPVYDKLFRGYNEEMASQEEKEADAVYDLLDLFPTFFERADLPCDHLLTTHDVAFRAGEEPRNTSRSDFLAGTVLNSTRGYRALKQGRLEVSPLAKSAPWHLDLDPILRCLNASTGTDPAGIEEALAEYDLEDDDERPVSSLRMERNAKEQLALDLSLSSDVYSMQPFAAPSDVDHALETMTEALTLCDEPPPVELSCLRASRKDHYDKDESQETTSGVGMGARCLMKEWELGTKVADYRYRDPYNTADEVTVEPPPRQPAAASFLPPKAPFNPAIPVVLPRPPTLVLAKSSSRPDPYKAQSQTQLPTVTPMRSQQTAPSLNPAQSQTQVETQIGVPSTQILPGPFGGRPTAKKKPRKRVGGF